MLFPAYGTHKDPIELGMAHVESEEAANHHVACASAGAPHLLELQPLFSHAYHAVAELCADCVDFNQGF